MVGGPAIGRASLLPLAPAIFFDIAWVTPPLADGTATLREAMRSNEVARFSRNCFIASHPRLKATYQSKPTVGPARVNLDVPPGRSKVRT